MIVNHNGVFVPAAGVAVNDGAVLFGDSLFETLKARGANICRMQLHLDRLHRSCRLLEMPFDRPRATAALLATAGRLAAPASRLRLTVSRGPFNGLAFPQPAAGYFLITAVPYTEPTDEERLRGIRCVFAPNRRVNPLSHLPQMKRGNYADCLYAANYALRNNAREALFVDENGNVLEGATSNLFIVQRGTLITPPIGNLILAGTMRQQVISQAKALGIGTTERQISKEELLSAEEAFLCNALIDLMPIGEIENKKISRGLTSRKLLQASLEQ